MADVRAERVDRGPAVFQCDRRVRAFAVFHPEPGTEALCQLSRELPPAVRALFTESVEQFGAAHGGLVRVPLNFAERDRSSGDAPVAELHGVRGVLPALIGQAASGLVDIAHEAVATAAGLGDPGQAALHRGQQWMDVAR